MLQSDITFYTVSTRCTVTLTDRKAPNLQDIRWRVAETETVAVDTPKEDESAFIHANT